MRKDIIITYYQWERIYKPIKEYGSYKDFSGSKNIALAKKEGRLWTEVAEGSFFSIIPGGSLVNRMAYYITEKPTSLGDFLLVEDPTHQTEFYVPRQEIINLMVDLIKYDPGTFFMDDVLNNNSLYFSSIDVEENRNILNAFCRKHKKQLLDTLQIRW